MIGGSDHSEAAGVNFVACYGLTADVRRCAQHCKLRGPIGNNRATASEPGELSFVCGLYRVIIRPCGDDEPRGAVASEWAWPTSGEW